ncbi:nucleotide-diphospho-sugar transferase [Boeremia exigua]|uniref:nucleotide-diphospho-sugar transferase n=1 Tax=Boeremia exigua TaxID=749465 RepID=UPI001E8E623E|nr:nucleotide-diphospho-sugar transferase [Boeremia exigua]KAH6633644.1 nucleotide-diphospho-sugar transferase [Boeremia exigua]
MAHSRYEFESFNEKQSESRTYNRQSYSVPIENVPIPAHLLRASVNLTSVRDTHGNPGWEYQPGDEEKRASGRKESLNRKESLAHRLNSRSTSRPTKSASQKLQNSQRFDRRSVMFQDDMPPSSEAEIMAKRKSRYRSWVPDDEVLTTSRPNSALEPTFRQQGRLATSNPFEDPKQGTQSSSSSFWSNDDPFATRPSSRDENVKSSKEPDVAYTPAGQHRRKGTLGSIVGAVVPDVLARKMSLAHGLQRKGSVWKTYENAKKRSAEMQREKWAQILFEYGIYLLLLCFIYFVLIGRPLWYGAVWWTYWVVENKFVFAGGFAITLGIALFYAFAPLLILFEKDPPPAESTTETKVQDNVKETALLIPCYKSAHLIAATLESALKIFPASHIFVLANGNSPTPLDNTEEICEPYGVNHLWCPIGSKIVAQYVGAYAAKAFKNVLLIDDDCALPDNFPVVTDRLRGNVMCLGYTIKSVGPNSSKGNLCQQAQDLEYKLSGIQREFAGKVGSATFPHGAIALWDRELLIKTFHEHPGFSVSEDWFFGHVARKLGSRIKMCSQVFVETETPAAVFFSSGGARGGFGEMTIFQQRFKRWNFFFVNGMYYNMAYILGSWKLGWWEIGAKIFVFQEVYETLLYLVSPFILPISFIVRPSFAGILLGATIVMYLLNTVIFNEVHLRRKNERLGWVLIYVYYLPYKLVLTAVNVASCYWSLFKYARYFAQRHPKVIEDEKAVEVIVRLEETQMAAGAGSGGLGRKLTVRTAGAKGMHIDSDQDSVDPYEQAAAEGIAAVDYASAPATTKSSDIKHQSSHPYNNARNSRRASQYRLSHQTSRNSRDSRHAPRSAGAGFF